MSNRSSSQFILIIMVSFLIISVSPESLIRVAE